MLKKEAWICGINVGENLDLQWQKVDLRFSTVAEGGNLGCKGNEVLGISVCCVSNQ